MPSQSLIRWHGQRSRELDQIAGAHAAVGGVGPGRRCATQQLNHAYLVLLASQFQGFCRDLHSEAVDHLVAPLPQLDVRTDMLRVRLTDGRQLDVRNAQPSSIGSDFGRLEMQLWPLAIARDSQNVGRRVALEELNVWRNAIAHQSFDPARLGGRTSARLADVRRLRRACDGLARGFDLVVGDHLAAILGVAPW